jgi:hypothetical protein
MTIIRRDLGDSSRDLSKRFAASFKSTLPSTYHTTNYNVVNTLCFSTLSGTGHIKYHYVQLSEMRQMAEAVKRRPQ